jgi:hypothetical protein
MHPEGIHAHHHYQSFFFEGDTLKSYYFKLNAGSGVSYQKVIAFAEEIRNEISTSKKFIDKITASIGIAFSDQIDMAADNYENIAKQDIENRTKKEDISGRSFTIAVAIYKLVRDGAELGEDIRSALVDSLASLINADYNKVDRHFTDRALVEAIDLEDLDEIAGNYYNYDE